MSSYFFIFKREDDGELIRLYVKGLIGNMKTGILTEMIDDFKEHYIDNMFDKSSEQISKIYKKNVNTQHIYFKGQYSFIKPCESITKNNLEYYDESKFSEILKHIDVFFSREYYDNYTNEELDKYKVIVNPSKLLNIIDENINYAVNLNKKIYDNHNKLFKLDFDLLEQKNNLLKERTPYNLTKIIDIIKERDMINYVIFDIDSDITNVLIELYNCKFIKLIKYCSILQSSSILDTLETIKNSVSNVEHIKEIFEKFEKKYLDDNN